MYLATRNSFRILAKTLAGEILLRRATYMDLDDATIFALLVRDPTYTESF